MNKLKAELLLPYVQPLARGHTCEHCDKIIGEDEVGLQLPCYHHQGHHHYWHKSCFMEYVRSAKTREPS